MFTGRGPRVDVRLMRTSGGRLRAVWRLALFYLLFLTATVLLFLPVAFLTGGSVGTGGLLAQAAVTLLAALGASLWAAGQLEGVSVASLGMPLDGLTLPEAARGFAVGSALMGLGTALLAVTGSLTWEIEPGGVRVLPLVGSFLAFTLFLSLAAWTEELLFRGYPLQAVAERAGGPTAVVVTSLLFAAAHLANPGLGSALLDGVTVAEFLPVLNLVLAGVVLGLAFWRTYSLWFATGVHVGWNWVMGFLADLPVSGLEPDVPGFGLFDTPGWDAVVSGGRLWTGGEFGPEGGLAVTLASLVGIAWLLGTDRLERGLRVRALNPLADRGAPATGQEGYGT